MNVAGIRELKNAGKRGHKLALQTYSGGYQRWTCSTCGASITIHDTPQDQRFDYGRQLEQRCTPKSVTQQSLFDDSAVDDWGDSKAQRTSQQRLL